MRALTVQQPWAWAIVHGGKDVENRTQAWTYRGPLAIQAGARTSNRGMASELVLDAARREQHHDPDARCVVLGWSSLTTGAIIGVVQLVGVHQAEAGCCESSWAEAAYAEHGGRNRRDVVHLVLEEPRPLTNPIPCKGRLGLWETTPDVDEAVRLDLAGEDWDR